MTSEEVQEALDQLRGLQTLIDQAAGKQAAAMSILKDEFKLSSLVKAKTRVANLQREREALAEELEGLVTEWQAKFEELL